MTLEQYARVYLFYRSALMRSVRLLILFFTISLILFEMSHAGFPKFSLFFFNLFAMVEVFFHYKIAKFRPTRTISKSDGKALLEAATQALCVIYLSSWETKAFIEHLLKLPQVRFILQKAAIEHEELPFIEVSKEAILEYGETIAKAVNGDFMTTMDILVAYLLMTEAQTRLLFNKKIPQPALMQILLWAKMTFPEEEHPKPLRFHFIGEGIGESLQSGWTPETQKYTENFTYYALRKPIFIKGREKEYQQLCEALAKREGGNVLLVGEIGTGKETLVEAFASDSFLNNLPAQLNHRRVLELMIGPLIAGATDRGDLEVRLQYIIAEIAHSGDVIAYLPQFENIMGASSYSLNISGALLPYLKDGGVPVIATMTAGNYKTYMEQNPMREVFTVIQIAEPERDVVIQMLFDKSAEIEEKQRVSLSYPALQAAITYADRYVQDGALPGSAITLLSDAANQVAVSAPVFGHRRRSIVMESDIVAKVEEKTHVNIAAPKQEEKEMLLHMEESLHKRVIGQDTAIKAIAEAMRRLRSGLALGNKPISFLFLGPTGVGKTETAKALADLYFGGEAKIIRLDMSEYSDSEGVKRLLGAAPGEGEERGELTDKIHDHPYSLVLLDEFEKANPRILDLFLQVLEDGRLTDNKGKTVSFANAIIIATSNAGAEFIREYVAKGGQFDKSFQAQLMDHLQSTHLFKPELLNRFDDVVTFEPLSQAEVAQVARLMLASVTKRLADQDITVKFDESVISKIAKEGYDPQFGARPLRRYLQDNIEDLIAQKELRDEIKRGNTVALSSDPAGGIQAQVS